MAEEAIAKHEEHLRELEEEGGPVTRERAMEQRREQRAEFATRRDQLRASAEPGTPRMTNAQLNKAIAEERGMTPEQMQYAIGHGPFRPA
jgi:predicted metal-dependent phosphoesterase TrpH